MSSIVKMVLMVVVISGIGFFGYNYLTRSSVEDTSLIRTESRNTSQMGAEVLSALNQLNVLRLDESIFSDSTFRSLQDFSRPIQAEPVGRVNPFSPLGIEAKISSTSTLKLASSTNATTSKTTTTR